jgi:hypothetical protein
MSKYNQGDPLNCIILISTFITIKMKTPPSVLSSQYLPPQRLNSHCLYQDERALPGNLLTSCSFSPRNLTLMFPHSFLFASTCVENSEKSAEFRYQLCVTPVVWNKQEFCWSLCERNAWPEVDSDISTRKGTWLRRNSVKESFESGNGRRETCRFLSAKYVTMRTFHGTVPVAKGINDLEF